MDQSVEVRLRCLECALLRDETAGQSLLYAGLYAAWVYKELDELGRLADVIRRTEGADNPGAPEPSAVAQPQEPPLPADFDLSGQTIRSISTVLPNG